MFYEGMEFGPYDKAEHTAHEAFELYEDGHLAQGIYIEPFHASASAETS